MFYILLKEYSSNRQSWSLSMQKSNSLSQVKSSHAAPMLMCPSLWRLTESKHSANPLQNGDIG